VDLEPRGPEARCPARLRVQGSAGPRIGQMRVRTLNWFWGAWCMLARAATNVRRLQSVIRLVLVRILPGYECLAQCLRQARVHR
jgi:hypothetical protein